MGAPVQHVLYLGHHRTNDIKDNIINTVEIQRINDIKQLYVNIGINIFVFQT